MNNYARVGTDNFEIVIDCRKANNRLDDGHI